MHEDELIKNRIDPETGEELDEDVAEIMENHGIDKEEAEEVKEIVDFWGIDEEDAVELRDFL